MNAKKFPNMDQAFFGLVNTILGKLLYITVEEHLHIYG